MTGGRSRSGPLDVGDDATTCLARLAAGDRSALGELFALVDGQLRRLAESQMNGERSDHTLQPTALVHEAFLRLTRRETIEASSRREFMAVASQAMRRVLIDHARSRGRDKRGASRGRVEFAPELDPVDDSDPGRRAVDLLDLEDVLVHLERRSKLGADIVLLRFFGGMTLDEVAVQLRRSRATVVREWQVVRALLEARLEP